MVGTCDIKHIKRFKRDKPKSGWEFANGVVKTLSPGQNSDGCPINIRPRLRIFLGRWQVIRRPECETPGNDTTDLSGIFYVAGEIQWKINMDDV